MTGHLKNENDAYISLERVIKNTEFSLRIKDFCGKPYHFPQYFLAVICNCLVPPFVAVFYACHAKHSSPHTRPLPSVVLDESYKRPASEEGYVNCLLRQLISGKIGAVERTFQQTVNNCFL